MRYLLSLLISFAWALWLGGLVALFVFVKTIFNADRTLAVQTAPVMFNAFEKYQLVIAAAGILSAGGLVVLARSRLAMMLMALMLACGAAGFISSKTLTAKMNSLREQGRSSTPEFRRLHGFSMAVYTGETALLGIAGLLLPAMIRSRPGGAADQEPSSSA